MAAGEVYVEAEMLFGQSRIWANIAEREILCCFFCEIRTLPYDEVKFQA